MRIIIDIPKEFEEHFKQDKFKDALNRLCMDAHLIAGNYEQETAIMLIKAFSESTEYRKKCDDCAGCTAWKCDCSNVRDMAIDDFAERLHDLCGFEIDDIQYPYLLYESRIDEIAEQLKKGDADNE